MIDAIEYALTILSDERTWMAAARKDVQHSLSRNEVEARMNRKSQISVALVMIIAGAIAPDFAGSDKPASPVTMRDLARELASVAPARAQEISARLSRLELGRAANTPLSEGDAAALLRAAGFTVTTSDPGRLLSRDRADALVRQFKASTPATPARGGNPHDNGVQPTELEACVQEANHGACVNCCKEEGGSASACAKLCFEINKPSSSEPLP
jgi:hypothetical protein